MMRISTVARLAIGLVLLTMSLIYGADLVGLIPNQEEAILEERKRTIESLGFCCSAAIQKEDITTILTSVDVLVSGNEDILSAAIRLANGELLVGSDNHDSFWKGALPNKSTSTHIQLPLYKENELWGTVEMAFKPIGSGGIRGFFESTFVQLFLFFSLIGFIVYRFYLKKTLQHLDPSSVIPPRVKAALDTLSEGIVLMDMDERIVFANRVFSEKIGEPANTLLGRKTSNFNWIRPKSKDQAADLPWMVVLRDAKSQTGIRLGLSTGDGKKRTFMASATPIMTNKETCRGVLATFNDVTKVEEQNEQLQIMIDKLEKSRDEVRSKNEKLEFYATRDPLTSCLNRRSFFERFDYDLARMEHLNQELSCIMIDIDHFKAINDKFGHSVGDRAIKSVGEEISRHLRDDDYVARYGGEEFCIVLARTKIENALGVAERIREKVEAETLLDLKVTISLGVSSTRFGSHESPELIRQADQALYTSKESGRNCVTLYDPLSVHQDELTTTSSNH
jgi:diguanylate cyclase (GGDEF)-like protein/PAS domain S-box-containing protein